MVPNKTTSKHAQRCYFWWGNSWKFWGLESMTQSDPMDVKWPFIVVVFQHRLDGFLQRCEVNLLRLRDKTLEKGDVNFDSKTWTGSMSVHDVFVFFSPPILQCLIQKKPSGEPKRAFSARCKLSFSHVSSTSACCAATKAANGDKSWECCCCLLLRSWLFLGLDSWHHQVTFVVGVAGTGMYLPEVELKGNSFLR